MAVGVLLKIKIINMWTILKKVAKNINPIAHIKYPNVYIGQKWVCKKWKGTSFVTELTIKAVSSDSSDFMIQYNKVNGTTLYDNQSSITIDTLILIYEPATDKIDN